MSARVLPAKVSMNVEKYLHASFEGADCEYLEGEIVERNMGEYVHARIQAWLVHLLMMAEPRLGIRVLSELRIQIGPRRYRVADLAVWRATDDIGDRIPAQPPFLAIEILSPEDRIVRMHPKIQEYLSIGVEWVWLVDPYERRAICFSKENPGGSLSDVLRTRNPDIELPLETVFQPLS